VKSKIPLDTLTSSIFDAIEEFGGKVYLVGGTVRDFYRNQTFHAYDLDVEVYQLTLSQLEKVLSQFGTVNVVGKCFGIVKVSCLPDVDFALPRKEISMGKKHTDFDVIFDPYMDKRVAAGRRDFTMNTLLYEYQTGAILDYYNGKEDIDSRLIRMVNPNAFKEDPLRILRAARFAARYQFDVEKKTMETCQKMVLKGALKALSTPRVYQEYCHILLAARPSLGFAFLSQVGALPKYLEDLKQTMQRLDYHPEGNVWNHTMLVIDLAAQTKHKSSYPLAFMWSCLLHDIGKPITTTPTGSAPKHHLVGVDVFRTQCTTLIQSKKMQTYIATMIAHHMELMHMAKNNAKDIKYYRLLKEIDGIFPITDLILFTKCDKFGRLMDSSKNIEQLTVYIEDKIKRLGIKALKPCITGKTLLSLGYQPSLNFSKMLEEAYTMQMQGMNKEDIIKEMKRKY